MLAQGRGRTEAACAHLGQARTHFRAAGALPQADHAQNLMRQAGC